MYQLGDVYNKNLNRKAIICSNIHIVHQHRDQVTGVERKKSITRKKKRDMVKRINLNTRNREIAELAKTFLANNAPVKTTV